MKNPVVHFEIGCRDSARSQAFYQDVFEWEIEQEGPSMNIHTGSDQGIQGHITSLGHEPHHYINIYIRVEDIPATLDKIEEKGGKRMVGPVPLPHGEHFAWFTDPDGNMVGLLSTD